jgi:tRNA G46 methylase TrmB
MKYFENKECLDIGCGDGSFLLEITVKYKPKKYIGIDLDLQLINQAI